MRSTCYDMLRLEISKGIHSGLKEALQGIECGIGYPGGIFALALGTGAEPVALDQGVELGYPTLKFNNVVQLLLKIGCHFNPPISMKR